MKELRIVPPETPEALAQLRALLLEYAASLGGHLCFDGFQLELRQLTASYGPPAGRLLLATVGDEPAGCVALKPVDASVCELKRLYVRPAFRGQGLGRSLARHALSEAGRIGYRIARLDTLPSMTSARALYRSLGFQALPDEGGEQPIVMELRLQGT
jgi:putative acetyltransferase